MFVGRCGVDRILGEEAVRSMMSQISRGRCGVDGGLGEEVVRSMMSQISCGPCKFIIEEEI